MRIAPHRPGRRVFRKAINQSSQMVSKSRSWRRSAPQTLHRFLLSTLPYPAEPARGTVRTSDAPRRLVPLLDASASSALSAAAFNAAMRSASRAASSASGMSGMVSSDEMLGLRERMLVGVEGMDEAEGVESPG